MVSSMPRQALVSGQRSHCSEEADVLSDPAPPPHERGNPTDQISRALMMCVLIAGTTTAFAGCLRDLVVEKPITGTTLRYFTDGILSVLPFALGLALLQIVWLARAGSLALTPTQRQLRCQFLGWGMGLVAATWVFTLELERLGNDQRMQPTAGTMLYYVLAALPAAGMLAGCVIGSAHVGRDETPVDTTLAPTHVA
jgi:hypothetical protein